MMNDLEPYDCSADASVYGSVLRPESDILTAIASDGEAVLQVV